MTSNITIKFSEILFDLQNKNAEEVRFIEEPQARYLAEAGTNKIEELKRCIKEAFSFASSLCLRFLSVGEVTDADDSIENVEDLTLSLQLSERRGAGKASIIADTLHSMIVNMALSKFYNTIHQTDLATKRENLAASDVQIFHKHIFTKLPPVFTTTL